MRKDRGKEDRGHRTKAAMGVAVAAALIAGCSAPTRERTLSLFFDGYAEGPPPPTHRVRRDLLLEIEELKRELERARRAAEVAQKAPQEGEGAAPLPAEQAKTWAEAVSLLATENRGNVDWVQALRTGTIAPRPGLDPKVPEQGVFALDVESSSSPGELYWVTFSHVPHTEWLSCGNCHPAIYPLEEKRRAVSVTMATLQAGESCGACHGTVAFGLEACARCHDRIPAVGFEPSEEPRTPVEAARRWEDAARLLPFTGGVPDWSRALAEGLIAPRPGLGPGEEDEEVMDLDVEIVSPESPLFASVFSHEAHTVWLSCESCHDDLFEMEIGANAIDMAKMQAGDSCGACHGTVAFGLEACARCHDRIPAVGFEPSEEPRTPIEGARRWEDAAKLLPFTRGVPDWSKALAQGLIAPRPGVRPGDEDEEVMDLDVKLPSSFSRRFASVFSHEAHTVWLSCENCHDELYEMEIGANTINMRKIRAVESCGVCHGTVAFGVKTCVRCHPDM